MCKEIPFLFYFLIEIQHEGVYGVFIVGFVVVMAEEKAFWVLGVGKRAIKVGGDELGAGDKRAPFL